MSNVELSPAFLAQWDQDYANFKAAIEACQKDFKKCIENGCDEEEAMREVIAEMTKCVQPYIFTEIIDIITGESKKSCSHSLINIVGWAVVASVELSKK